MRSRFARAASVLSVAWFGCSVVGTAARADAIYGGDVVRHGRVVELDAKGGSFVEGCSAGSPSRWDWGDTDDIVFDGRCDGGGVRPTAAGGGVCTTKAA